MRAKRVYLLIGVISLSIIGQGLIASTPTKGKIGHFGTCSFEAWYPPLGDEPGPPLDEVKEYLEWESAQLAEAGIRWVRTLSPMGWPFSWYAIERTKGNYDFTWADLEVKATQNHNISLLAMVIPFTPWDRPDCADISYGKPNDMDSYKNFMTKLVERYDNDGIDDMPGLKYGVKYWELGNEPYAEFLDGASAYVEILQAGYEAVKEADPDAKILNGGAVPVYDPMTAELSQSTLDYWDEFFAAGGGDYVDIFNIHYTIPEPAPPLKDFLNQWNRLLQKHGIEKETWLTETGTYSGEMVMEGKSFPFQSEEYQASWWVKHACYGLAHGVTKLFWGVFYNPGLTLPGEPEPWQPYGAMVNSDKSPKLIYTTQQILSSKIDDFSSVQELAEGQYKFIVHNNPIYVLWGTGSPPSEISGRVTITDISGNKRRVDASQITLSDSPIFLEMD